MAGPPPWPSPVHRARIDLRLPQDPQGATARDPRQLPATPDRRHRLVPRARDQRRPAGTDRHPARAASPAGRSAVGSPASASPPPRSRSIGLSRWVLLVPGVSDDATVPGHRGAHRTFDLLHSWLGTVLGETIGYALTAAFTVLVVSRALARGQRSPPLDGVPRLRSAAALIATGVVIPLGLAAAASPTSSATSPGASGSSRWPSCSGGRPPPCRRRSAVELRLQLPQHRDVAAGAAVLADQVPRRLLQRRLGRLAPHLPVHVSPWTTSVSKSFEAASRAFGGRRRRRRLEERDEVGVAVLQP